jgi:hypothetical protein
MSPSGYRSLLTPAEVPTKVVSRVKGPGDLAKSAKFRSADSKLGRVDVDR